MTDPALKTDRLRQTVVVLGDKEPIDVAVHAMIDKAISCVLIEDKNEVICGIVTERDIVRRLTLSSKKDKLQAKVRAIMTYPVLSIPPTDIKKNLRPLLFHQRLRHFPIATTNAPKSADLIGMVTVTDLARMYVMEQDDESPPIEVALIASRGGYQMQLRHILIGLGHVVIPFERCKPDIKAAVVVDLDDPIAKDKELLNRILGYPHRVIFLTSRAESYAPIRTRLKNPKHHVLLKPVDFTVLGLLLADAARQGGPNPEASSTATATSPTDPKKAS